MASERYTDDDVRVAGDAIDRWLVGLGWPDPTALRPYGAGRAVLDALTTAGWVRMDPAEPHLIEFRPDGWTIQHPVRCRPNLFACPVNRVAGEQIDGPPASGPGVYECDVEDGTLVLDYSTRREVDRG
jgi:hypothetical protein